MFTTSYLPIHFRNGRPLDPQDGVLHHAGCGKALISRGDHAPGIGLSLLPTQDLHPHKLRYTWHKKKAHENLMRPGT
jgi:hypothetical protein